MKLDSLEELEVLQAVVETGSVAAAGRRLGLPARTVGRRLAGLESRLGVTLVPRTTRTLGATPAARRFAQRCAVALRDLATAEALLQAELDEVEGRVRLAVPSLWANHLLDAIGPLGERFPLLELDIDVTDAPLAPLHTTGLDIAVTVHRPTHGADTSKRLLKPRESVLAAAPSYLSARSAPRRPESLADHACLRFTGLDTWVLTRGPRRVEVKVAGPIQSSDSRLLREAVIRGRGIGPVHEGLLAHERLTRVLPGWSWPSYTFWMVVAPASRHLPRVGVVKEVLEGMAV